jgi:DNA-binding ferritin-like protein
VEPLPADFVQKKDLVPALSERIAEVVKRIRVRIGVVEKLDPVSADLLITAAAGLEKTLWMLQAENS